MEVLHQQCPPRTVLGLHDTTLMGIITTRGIRTGRTHAKLRPVLTDTVFRTTGHHGTAYATVAISLIGTDHTRLVRSPDTLRTRAERASIG